MMRDTLSEVQRWLTSTGFVDGLIAVDGRLYATASGKYYAPEDLVVAASYRFEGQSDPGDEAILFALATPDGQPVGTFTAAYGPAVSPTDEAVILALRQAPFPPDEIRAHAEHDHIAAIFPTRTRAEAAVAELRRLGLGSEHLGIAIHGPTPVVFEHDEDADVGHDVEVGTAAGASVGVIAGMAIGAIAISGLGALGVAGLFALGAAGGFGGAMLGGYLGVAAADRSLTEHEELAYTPLKPGEVLVAVCSHGHPGTIEAVMERNGGHLLPPLGARG